MFNVTMWIIGVRFYSQGLGFSKHFFFETVYLNESFIMKLIDLMWCNMIHKPNIM